MIARRQKALASGNESLFKLLRNKVNRERKRCRKIYCQSKVKELRRTKPCDWWREIKELCGNNKGRKINIQSILNPDINYTDEALSDKINKAFVSVLEKYCPLPAEFRVNTDDDEPKSVTEETVVKKLKEICISRSSGPDNLPNWMLKEFAYALAPSITDILKSSFHEEKVYGKWQKLLHYRKTQFLVILTKICGQLVSHRPYLKFLKALSLKEVLNHIY